MMQHNKDIVEPTSKGQIYLGSPMYIGQNFDSELYSRKVKHYEAQARDYWSIKEITKKKVHNFFSVSLIPKIFENKV